jgi:CcmD family protein
MEFVVWAHGAVWVVLAAYVTGIAVAVRRLERKVHRLEKWS